MTVLRRFTNLKVYFYWKPQVLNRFKTCVQITARIRVTPPTITWRTSQVANILQLVSNVSWNGTRQISKWRSKIAWIVQKGYWSKNQINCINSEIKVFDWRSLWGRIVLLIVIVIFSFFVHFLIKNDHFCGMLVSRLSRKENEFFVIFFASIITFVLIDCVPFWGGKSWRY